MRRFSSGLSQLRTQRAMCVAGFVAAALLASGCARDRAAEYRADLTPETATLGNSHPDIHNKSAAMLDTNISTLLEDWARMGLWDRPSRLTRKPIPR